MKTWTWTWTFVTRFQDLQAQYSCLGLEKTLVFADVLCWTLVYVNAVLGSAQERD